MDPSGQTPQPPAPDAQPSWAQPGAPPPGAWAAPAPAKKSSLPKIIAAVVVVLVILGGAFFAMSYIKNNEDAGKVVFSTNKPVAGETIGCAVDNKVTTVKVGVAVYATYHFKSKQGSAPVSLAIAKDGVEVLPATALSSSLTSGLNCLADTTNLSELFTQPGTYKITVTSGGDTIAEGTLVVTP
jgi:hypothetical protein